jgi:hypothetical protein
VIGPVSHAGDQDPQVRTDPQGDRLVTSAPVPDRPEPAPQPGHAPADVGRDSVALYVAMAGIALMGFNRTRLADMPVSDLVFMVAAVAIAMGLLAGRTSRLATPRARRSSPPVLIGTILFLTAGTVSAFQSWDSGRSVTVMLRFAWVTLGWFWVLRSVVVDRAALAKLLGAWRVMVLFNSAVVVLGNLHILQWGGLHGSGNRQVGFFDEPNDLAGLLVVGLPLILLGVPRPPESGPLRGRDLLVRGIPSVLVIYGVATTGSMSAFLAAVVGGVTMIAAVVVARPPRTRRPRSPLLPMVVVAGAVAGVALLAASDVPVVERFTEFNSGDQATVASVASRGERNDIIIERFDSLLVVGEGFGGFDPTDQREVLAGGAHNMIMLTVLQAGLPGVVGLLTILFFSVRNAMRLVVNTRGTDLHPVAVSLLASVVTATTFAMFQPTLYHRYYWLPIGLIGALWSLRRQELRDRQPVPAETVA